MKEGVGRQQEEDGAVLNTKAAAAASEAAAPSTPPTKTCTPRKDPYEARPYAGRESPEPPSHLRQGHPESRVQLTYRASPPHSRSYPHSYPSPPHRYAPQVTPYSAPPKVGLRGPYYPPPPPPRYGDYAGPPRRGPPTGSPNHPYRGPLPPPAAGDPYYPPPPPPRMHNQHSRHHPPGVYAHEDVIPQSNGKLTGCTCKKSKCLKLYCQCFASSTTCGPKCKCGECHNTTMHAQDIESARQTILYRNSSAFDKKTIPPPMRQPPLEWTSTPGSTPYQSLGPPRRPSPPPPMHYSSMPNHPPHHRVNQYGCKCKRSFCLKKYCECFQNASHCGLNCRCTNCKNVPAELCSPPPPSGLGPYASPRSLFRHLRLPPPRVSVRQEVQEEEESKEQVARDSVVVTRKEEEEETIETASLKPQDDNASNDRMAMMAAVAMTELLAGPKETAATTTLTTPVANEKEQDTPTVDNKRKQVPTDETQARVPLKKRKTLEQPPSQHRHWQHHEEKELAMESRNPSPVSNLRGSPSYGYGTPPSRSFSYESAGPPPPPMMHHHHPRHGPPPHVYEHHYRASPPRSGYRASPPPPYYPPPPHYHRASPPPYRASPPPPMTNRYEEMLKTTGLPKSLSFRKICSKCGKTRGEHGELGFGNKCVFQDCGKCGAGVHAHEKADEPMGILCQLTVEQGATPGMAVGYERKIRELAARADLQREIRRKQQAV